MARHNVAWWAKRVEELAKGGDADAVARRHHVRARTLCWWRSELRRRARETGGDLGPRMLPVVVTDARNGPALGHALEVVIEVGAARFSARGDLSPDHLAALVGRLVDRC